MNRLSPAIALLAAALAGGSALRAAPPVIGSQLFQETNARIEELFRHRNHPPKLPGPEGNPFRTVDPSAPLPAAGGPATNASNPIDSAPRETVDEALLRQAYASLTFGGLLEVGDRQLVMINKATYKEGGLISVRVQNSMVYLRIVTLTKDSITLGLGEARLTLHF